jgi:thymidylate synthase
MIEVDSISNAWIEGLRQFTTTELNRYDSRLGPCVEIENLLVRIRNPRATEDLTKLYPSRLSLVIDRYAGSFLDPDNVENSTNSKRLYEWRKGFNNDGTPTNDQQRLNQVARVIDRIVSEPGSRQNVVAFWDPEIDWTHPNPVAPLVASFKAPAGILHSTLIVRSVDAYLGTLPMFVGFKKLHDRIAQESGIRPGSTSFLIWSYHVYEMDLPAISDLLDRENS